MSAADPYNQTVLLVKTTVTNVKCILPNHIGVARNRSWEGSAEKAGVKNVAPE